MSELFSVLLIIPNLYIEILSINERNSIIDIFEK
jgi:hypothetical protein